MIRRVKTIDAHAEGEPLRLVVDGCPRAVGTTMMAKRKWAYEHLDALRCGIMHEPRGHGDMYGAVLTEPVEPGSHAGVLFMHTEGFSTMCGHGVIAIVTVALERGLLHVSDPSGEIVLDTPAGIVRATAERRDDRVTRVSFVNVPSFVLSAGVAVRIGSRDLRADIAYGGAFYAIVDTEAAGVPLRSSHLPELQKLGMQIKGAVESLVTIAHPEHSEVEEVYGTVFTGLPDADDGDLRNVTVFADGQIDRSPCGTGTAAVMAVLDAMGLLAVDRPFVHESIIGTRFVGRVEDRTMVGEYPAIRPRIEGSAWITGEHEFLFDDADPLKDGFRLRADPTKAGQ